VSTSANVASVAPTIRNVRLSARRLTCHVD
jgi:hypothetical protein